MKKKIGGIGLCMLAWSILTCAQTITPQAEQRAREIVSKMTRENRVYLRIYQLLASCNPPFGNS